MFCRRQNSDPTGPDDHYRPVSTTITTRTVEYLADGLTMIGHLALPAGADRRPAVLLGPEGMGLSDVERRWADALAELGYVAPAFDLHGGRYLDDPEEMLARCLPLLAGPSPRISPRSKSAMSGSQAPASAKQPVAPSVAKPTVCCSMKARRRLIGSSDSRCTEGSSTRFSPRSALPIRSLRQPEEALPR